jgi:hypothetical protein
MNRKVYLMLAMILYSGICTIFLASGYRVEYCLNLLGFAVAIQFMLGIIMVIVQMALTVASDDEKEASKRTNAPDWILKISKSLPEWVKEALGRAGAAGQPIFQLLTVFNSIIVNITIGTSIIFGIGYFFSTSGQSLVPDFVTLLGQIVGLYCVYYAWTIIHSWLEKESSV